MLGLDAKMLIQVVAVLLFTGAAVALDLRTRKIPNYLTVPAFILGLIFQCAFDGWDGLKSGLAGFGLGFGTLLVLWLIGGGGAGDVKLMGALGTWLGGQVTLLVMIVSTAFVAVGSVLFLMIETTLRGWSATRRRYMDGVHDDVLKKRGEERDTAIARWRQRRRIMPYALPVGLATWVILAWKVYQVSV